jgi:hypothetical protein
MQEFSFPHRVFRAFAKSQYGERLAGKIRYERYKPDIVSAEHWIKLLGPDVDNLKHLLVSLGTTKRFVALCRQESRDGFSCFSTEDENDLAIVAVTHDFGEAVIGDISWDEKTSLDEHEELRHLRSILSQLVFENGEIFPQEKISRVIDILGNADSRLGRSFNVIERMGYVATGVRALNICNQGGHDLELRGNLEWLASNVLANQIERLLQVRKEYFAVDFFLNKNYSCISEAFLKISDVVFSYYAESGKEANREKFYQSKEAWFSEDKVAALK